MVSAVKKSNKNKKKLSLYVNGTGDAHNQLETFSSDNIDVRFINRDLSWIEFNARVICQSADSSVPLLERLKFLSIATNNFDEFFMKRIGNLQGRLLAGVGNNSVDGFNIKQQLSNIRKRILPLLEQQSMIFLEDIKPALNKEGIHLLKWSGLNQEEQTYANDYFNEKVFPLLTPLAVDAGHPFPFLSNLSTSLAYSLKHPKNDDLLFARIKLPESLPCWILLNSADSSKEFRFLNINELIMQHSAKLFPGMTVISCMPFRVTRNVHFEIDEEDAEDLLELVESHLRQQRLGQIIRLEHGENPDPWILNFLTEELSLNPDEVYELKSELDFKEFEPIIELNLPKLKYPRFISATPASLQDENSIFYAIKNHDILLHHPYESFSSSVERFVREASTDPKVLSIKMTVYRVGQVTPLIPYLISAAEQGKQVVCLVELKARFDEKQNIHWASTLEESGVHVVYGIPGLKTHAKTILVVRQDADAIRAYAHVGTGNYHAKTANLYTDLGLFTAKKEITSELIDFFNYLTGRSLMDNYTKLLVAPINMEKNFIGFIQQEIENKKAGKPAHIIAKMNSLEDQHIIEELYKASQAGVQIDLIIRGICCLRPKVKDLSENIRVISVVGRLLEHSRLFYFRNAKEDPSDGDFFIGSADWMFRNLHRRIEVSIPIEEKAHKERCMQIFNIMLSDIYQSWELNNDASYTRLRSPQLLNHNDAQNKEPLGPHELLMSLTSELNNIANL